MVDKSRKKWFLRILETPDEMEAAEQLQRSVWPGSETDVVPLHLLVTVAHNGGLVIGALTDGNEAHNGEPVINIAGQSSAALVGLVCGFPGLYYTPDGPRPKHCSHMLGVYPDFRDLGLGFALKRAQWQMVRHQGLDLITWTFDPLLSRNAQLNIARLGGVSNTYLREIYGNMRDDLNVGLPSDRFQVDWWVNSRRVNRRLSKRARRPLTLAHCLNAGAQIINPAEYHADGWPHSSVSSPSIPDVHDPNDAALLLIEIPSDFQALRATDRSLALEWRLSTRSLFEDLFSRGYLITDFVHVPGDQPRSFYVLSHGESTL